MELIAAEACHADHKGFFSLLAFDTKPDSSERIVNKLVVWNVAFDRVDLVDALPLMLIYLTLVHRAFAAGTFCVPSHGNVAKFSGKGCKVVSLQVVPARIVCRNCAAFSIVVPALLGPTKHFPVVSVCYVQVNPFAIPVSSTFFFKLDRKCRCCE